MYFLTIVRINSKAIVFDETSGQFYPVGSNVFATGTGNLTSSTSSQPRRLYSSNSPAFTTELAVGNVFKYTREVTQDTIDKVT